MAGRGNPKGSNGGGGMLKGQKRGETKKQFLARVKGEHMESVAAQAAGEAAPADAPRNKLGKQILEEAANYFFGLAALYQPNAPTADEKKFERYLDKAADIAAKLAPYQSPRLANTVLQGDKDAPVHHRVQFEFVDGAGKTVSAADALAGSIRVAPPPASSV